MLRFVLFLSFALGLYQTAAAGVVRVADGDCAGLSDAVTAASKVMNGERMQVGVKKRTLLLTHLL